MRNRAIMVFPGVLAFFLVVFPAHAGQPSPAKPAKKHKSMSYTMQFSEDGGDTMQFEFNQDGKKSSFIVREKSGDKFNTVSMMISDGKASYIVNPEEKMAMKFGKDNPMASSMFPFMQWMVDPDWVEWAKVHENNPNYSIKEKGAEKVRGEKCKVMEFYDKVNKDKTMMYISGDNVVKRWVFLPGTTHEKKTTMDLLNYSVDKPVKPEKVAVPKGYQVQDMSQMMMPKMPGP